MQKSNRIKTVEVKKAIPYGGIKEIAKRSKTSEITVSRVIKGRSKNPTVMKAMTEYLQELTSTKQQLNQLVELNLC